MNGVKIIHQKEIDVGLNCLKKAQYAQGLVIFDKIIKI